MKNYKIFNDVIDREIELKLFEREPGIWAISYESMEDLLFNQMPENLEVNYRIDVITATADYAAAKCEISDIRGRHTFGVGDVSVKSTTFPKETQKIFSNEHPVTPAVQAAISAAVQKYLNLPKTFEMEKEETDADVTTESISDSVDIEQDLLSGFIDIDDNSDAVENTEDEFLMEDDEEMMEDPADHASADSVNAKTNDENVREDDKTADVAETAKNAEPSATSEYDNAIFPSGTYAGKTCKYVWENCGDEGRAAIREAARYSTAGRWKNVVMFAKEHMEEK